jgi:hypothetical protein
MPVKCVRCGETGFTPNLIGGDGSVTNLQMSNVTLGGACPKCGGDMKVIDGSYNITNGVVTAFRALDATQLKDMQAILQGSREGKLTAEAATEQAAAISPDMAALVAALQRQPQWTAPVIVNTLLAVLAVVLAWMALHQASSLTNADHAALEHDIQTAIQRVEPKAQFDLPRVYGQVPASHDQRDPPAAQAKSRRKRPPKTYGRNKKHRR